MTDKLESKYREHYDAWKASPGPTTATNLLGAIDPIVRTGIKTYGLGADSPILRSRARRLALDAMPRYDPAKARLSTFLMNQLQGLRRVSADTTSLIHFPEQVRLDKQRMSEHESELQDRLGRAPSTTELADHSGLSLSRIAKIRSSAIDPINASAFSSGEEESPTDPAIRDDDENAGAWREFVYHGLNPRDQVILEHSLGMHGRKALSNNDIAAKLKISPAAVSQRRSKIQAELDMASDLGGSS